MTDPHAHHILFKKGLGPAQQNVVEEGQAILRRAGIDPIFGPENLVWAPQYPKGQHGPEALEQLLDGLRALERAGATREQFVKLLARFGREAARRV